MANTLDKYQAGELIRKRREQLGLTQEQVVEASTVTVAAYLSELETGKVNVARSKHLASLAQVLKLSEDDIRAINPSAVFTFAPIPSDKVEVRRAERRSSTTESVVIPEGLLEAGEKFATLDPLIAHPKVQVMLARQGNFGGRGPKTARDWWNYFESVRQYIEVDE